MEPTIKVQIYMQYSKVKIYRKTRKKGTNNPILGRNKQTRYTKIVHPQKSLTDIWENIIYFHGSNNYVNNDKWIQELRHSEEVIIHAKIQLKKGWNKFGQKVYEAKYVQMIQLHQRTWFKPIKLSYLNPRDKKDY